MATFTTPRTWTSTTLASSELNTDLRDNVTFLGEDRISHRSYTPTLTDVDNTVTETVTLSATTEQAIADGEHLLVVLDYIYRNNNVGTTLQIDVRYGGVEATLFSETMLAVAAEVRAGMGLNWIRAGSDMEVSTVASHEDKAGGMQIQSSLAVTLAAPSFAASGTLELKITHGAAHANTYFRPQAARVLYLGSIST